MQVTWSSWELWERIGGVSLIKNGQECSKALWEPIETRTRTFLCQAASDDLAPGGRSSECQPPSSEMSRIMVQLILQMISKKKPTTVFSCPTSQNKVYCGVGEAFFKERKGGLKGYFHLPFLPVWTGKRNGLESLARPRELPICWTWGPSQTFFIIHAYMQTKYLRDC